MLVVDTGLRLFVRRSNVECSYHVAPEMEILQGATLPRRNVPLVPHPPSSNGVRGLRSNVPLRHVLIKSSCMCFDCFNGASMVGGMVGEWLVNTKVHAWGVEPVVRGALTVGLAQQRTMLLAGLAICVST
jgi:hypothetical protein